MTAPYADAAVKARKVEAAILRAVHDQRQVAIAAAMGIHESTVSRLLSEQLPRFAEVLARAGLKVVPEHFRCVDPEVARAIELLHERAMARAGSVVSLMWEPEEE